MMYGSNEGVDAWSVGSQPKHLTKAVAESSRKGISRRIEKFFDILGFKNKL